MQLTCIVPGWHAAVMNRDAVVVPDSPDGAPGPEPAVDEIAQALRVRSDGAPCWWTATLQALELTARADGAGTDGARVDGAPAANDWPGRTEREWPPGQLLRADPVSLRADRDSAILHPPGALGLDGDESARLAADLNAFLADDGLVLHAVTPTSWYLSGDGLPPLLGPSPDALAFRTLDASHDTPSDTPSGDRDGARRLRTLQSEIEMVLHAHPVNVARRSSGRPAVTGLHLWGAAVPLMSRVDRSGRADRADRAASGPTGKAGARLPDLVVGEAAFVRHAALVAGVRCVNDVAFSPTAPANEGAAVVIVDLSLRPAWLRGDGAALERARAAFVARHLVPLRAAGLDLAWRPAAGTGLRIVAESGWCHEGALPPASGIATAVARVAARARALLRRSAPGRPGR